ncbi:MAG: hypothetical protein C4576_31450 [Desulfobacteraceae bacterium]|nr:MAG: hypothetical protein C4576_31450 [Desulfobacteraceae bacterium]
MDTRSVTHVFIATILFGVTFGCVTTGDVVNVTTLKGADSSELKPAERAQIEEIRKSKKEQGVDPSLGAIIQKTPNYTVTEYLATHPDAEGRKGQDYRVGGYDVINILVYEEKDLSRDAIRVSADGYISLPFVGRIKVDNLTTGEIESLISRKLAEGKYLLDAHVSVTVQDYKSKRYMVLGSIGSPGTHTLQAQERVLDAISKSGGPAAGGKRAMLVRTVNPGAEKEQKIVIKIDLHALLNGKDQLSNLLLMDKDVLYIPPAEYFYIMGQVRSPGSIVIPDKEITLVEAISMAGGFTNIAGRNRTRIIRVENGVEQIITVKVDAITDAGMKIQDVLIKPDDIIVVPESFF